MCALRYENTTNFSFVSLNNTTNKLKFIRSTFMTEYLNSMSNDSSATTSSTDVSVGDVFRRQVSFGVLQTCQIFSLLAYLFVGYHILASPRELKKTLSLHVVFILLVLNFIQVLIDISLALQFLNTGIVRPSLASTCTVWMFIDSFTYYLGLLLMAWASFERHLLIFHSQLFNTQRRRFLFHYLPISILCTHGLVFYVFVDFFYPCTNTFDFTMAFCGLVCYMNLSTPTVFGIEMMAHQVLSTFFIGLFSIGLLVRTIISRQRLQRSVEWRKYRKMIIQLLSISIVYLIFSVPFSINPLAQLAGKPTPFPYDLYLNIFSYWAYGIAIFLPVFIAASSPNIVLKLKQLMNRQRVRHVTPMSVNVPIGTTQL